MVYNFDELPDRRDTECVKWNAYPKGTLPMWVADMDFRSPEPVICALRDRVEHGVFGYPEGVMGEPSELVSLRELLIERMDNLYGWQITLEDLFFMPGVVTGFNQVCHALAKPGGKVLVQPPVYPPILFAAKQAGMTRQDAILQAGSDGIYSIDFDAFEAAITADTRVFILCNPHNPVGRVFRRDELEKMAEICLRHGVVICSDEIHGDLIFSGYRHLPIASLDAAIAQNTITLMAPSKTFNLAGLQFSFAVIQNPELRSKFRKAQQGLVPWVNLMGLVAGEAAYRHGQEWLDQLLVYLGANRDELYSFVQQEMPGVRMVKPEGTYLAWLDCRQAGIEGSPYRFFLEKAGVALNDGTAFGSGGEGYVRLNFGCPRSVLRTGLERMADALRSREVYS